MPLHHPPGSGQRARANQHRGPGGVEARDALAAGRTGAQIQAAPDPLPRRAGPNAKLRALVVPQEPQPAAQAAQPADCEANCVHHRAVRLSWAKLLNRVFELDLEHCPNSGVS